MYWTVQEETAAGLCSSSSTEQPSGMGQSLAKCSPLTWRSTSRISVEVASTETQCPVWWSLRYLLNQSYPGCWQGVIAPTRSVAFITVSLRPEVITQQLISPGNDLQHHRAALHPHSLLPRRRWEWCYQWFAHGPEDNGIWFKVTLSVSQNWTP